MFFKEGCAGTERVTKKQLALMVIVVGELRQLATVYSSLDMIGFVGGV